MIQSSKFSQTIDYLSLKDEVAHSDKQLFKDQEMYLTELRTWLDIHQRETKDYWETLG